jgi:alpha-amylase
MHVQNDWMGPPSFENGTTKDANCYDGEWICEHRWREISNMVKFHNAVAGQPVTNWYDNGNNMIAFGRGNRGFLVINNEPFFMSQRLQTGLPAGTYCDVISCDNNLPPCGNSGGRCRPEIVVDESGFALFTIPNGDDPMIALYN